VYSLNSMRTTHSNLKFIKTIWFIPLLRHCYCLKIFLSNFSYSFMAGHSKTQNLEYPYPGWHLKMWHICLWFISLLRRCLVQICPDMFHSLPRSLQENARIVPWWCNNHYHIYHISYNPISSLTLRAL
jgi:hypothetical protein